MDIDRYIVVSLEKIIINIDQCYGHRDDDHQETINEHIQLCTKYLKEIFKFLAPKDIQVPNREHTKVIEYIAR